MRQQRTEPGRFGGVAIRPEPARDLSVRHRAQPERGAGNGAVQGTARGMPGLAVLFLLSLLPHWQALRDTGYALHEWLGRAAYAFR